MDTYHNHQFSLQQQRAIHQQIAAEGQRLQLSGGGDAQRYQFTHFSEFWPHSIISRGDEVFELPVFLQPGVAEFGVKTPVCEMAFSDFVESSNVDAAIILHQGRVVFEAYPRMSAHEKHMWFSVSKIVVSLSVAVLKDRGLVDPSQPVCAYFPVLRDTDWESVRVIDLLDMCSGIDCLQAFDDPNSNHWRLLDAYGCFGSLTPCSSIEELFDFLGSLRLHCPPGQTFEYSFVNPMMLTLLVEAISQQPFADFVTREIWQAMGAEVDAIILNAHQGRAVTPFGMSSTLRDLARFGLLFTPTAHRYNRRVVSESHIQKLQEEGRPELLKHSVFPNLTDDNTWVHNTYQWDHVMADGDFLKSGAFGQGLYVSPAKDLVVAFFSTCPEGCSEMPRIARQLAKADLWD
jgi:CubicO group peptidase (beta-lactamase class C family)